ncbi:MAG: hypothetical protein ACXAB7_09185 [Candidatus Kariarchaeaceae archaeon]
MQKGFGLNRFFCKLPRHEFTYRHHSHSNRDERYIVGISTFITERVTSCDNRRSTKAGPITPLQHKFTMIELVSLTRLPEED